MTPIIRGLVATTIALVLTIQAAPAVKTAAYIIEELAEKDPKIALVEARQVLKNLRASDIDRGAVAYAEVATGWIATSAGEHKEAVELLLGALPVIAKMRNGELLADEYGPSLSLIESLEALGRFEDAVNHLNTLLERAKKGVIVREKMGQVRPDERRNHLDASDVIATNDWVINLLDRLGDMQLQQEEWDGAEKSLREAEVLLMKEFPGEQQARLIKIRGNGDIAARKQGKKIRPRVVGRFGHPNAIRIEGEKEVTEKEIRSALRRSGVSIFSSHPVSDFEPFLKKLKHSLEGGYKVSGFPHVVVKVDWDEERSEVFAEIKEGPRYRMGEIYIEGSKLLAVDDLKEELIDREGDSKKRMSQSERTFRKLESVKRLPKAIVEKVAKEKFPWLVADKDPAESDPENGEGSMERPSPKIDELFKSDSDMDEEKAWSPGKWVDYRNGLGKMNSHLHKAYAAAGRRYPEFETEWILREGEAIADVSVKVLDEGLAMELGTIYLVGNRANTREEVLDYLGLKQGMPIKQGFVDDLRRKLFDSGRFLGWEVLTVQASAVGAISNQLELLLVVAEHWNVPSLSVELSREQAAIRTLAHWINGKAKVESDLVFSVETERKSPVTRFECALGGEGLALAVDMRDRTRFRGVLAKEGAVEFFVQSLAKTFRIATPITGNRASIVGVITDEVETEYSLENPQGSLKTHNISFNIGTSTSTTKDGEIILGLDPTTAVSTASGMSLNEISFDDGEVTAISEGWTLRFEEESGRLLDARMEDESKALGKITLSLRSEQGAFARIRKEANPPAGSDMVNLDLNSPISLGFAAMASMVQFAKNENPEGEALATDKILDLVMSGIKRWEPPATALGNFFSSLMGNPDEDEKKFQIPMEMEDFILMQRSSYLMMFLSFGGYDFLDQFVEPGSWPDRVLRESVFFMGGQAQHLNETVKDLLKDESMGPLGSLLCSTLLQKVNHPEARAFLRKAEGELNEDGFAKDWRQLVRGEARDESPGWLLLEALKVMEDGQLDDIFPDHGSENRKALDELISEIRAINPSTEADALGPIMARVWKRIEPEMSTWVESELENLTPGVDPAKVAITVMGRNGFLEVRRGVIPFMELVTPGFGAKRVALTWEEECLDYLLFARQIWNTGFSASEDFLKKAANDFERGLGPDNWKKMADMGLTREQFEKWVDAFITGFQYRNQLLKNAKITENEVKDFYDQRKDLFGAVMKWDVWTISKGVNGDGKAEFKELVEISEKVSQEEKLEAQIAAFKKLGGADFTPYKGYAPTGFGGGRSAVMKGMIQDKKKLSAVFAEQFGEQKNLTLMMLPGDPRMGAAKPFEDVRDEARKLAIIDRERKRLRQLVQIDRFEMPAPGAPAPPQPKKADPGETPRGLAQEILEGWESLLGSAGEIISPGTREKTIPLPGGTLQEYRLIQKKASEGSGEALYYLGTYAERKIGKEPSMEMAVKRYEEAAEKEEVNAMIRLAELYRIGRGVPKDDVKSLKWRKKAAEVESAQSKK